MKKTIFSVGIIFIMMINVFSFINVVDLLSATLKGKVSVSGGIVNEVGGSTSITYTFEVYDGTVDTLQAHFSWDSSLVTFDKREVYNLKTYGDVDNGELSVYMNQTKYSNTCSITMYFKNVLPSSKDTSVPIQLAFEEATAGYVEFGSQASGTPEGYFALSEIELPTSEESSIVQELVVDVQINPSSVATIKGSSQQFTSTIKNDDNLGVVWSVDGSDSSIDTNGLLYVGVNESAKMLEVRATSIKDSSKVAIAKVQVLDKEDEDKQEETNKKLQLTAQGFVLDYDEVQTIDETLLISKANAKAMFDDKEVGSIYVNTDDFQQVQMVGEAGGILPVNLSATYTDPKGTIQTDETWVYVVVKGKLTLVAEDIQGNTLAISGSGFVLNTSDVAILNKEIAITQGNVEAVVIETKEKVDNVVVDGNELNLISNTTKLGGIFDLSYTVENANTSILLKVKVFVIPEDSETAKDITLLVNGFMIDYDESKIFDWQQAIARAIAYEVIRDKNDNITDVITIPVFTNDDQLNIIRNADEKGEVYDLLYYASNEDYKVSTSVKVFVQPNYTTTNDTSINLTAEGFSIEYKELKDLDATNIKANDKANVSAKKITYANDTIRDFINISDQVSIDHEELKAIQSAPKTGGIYDLTLHINDQEESISKTIKVVVLGENTPSIVDAKEKSLSIHATDFTIDYSSAKKLNELKSINKANAQAWEISKSIPLEVHVNEEDLISIQKAPENGGEYNLLFYAVYTDENNKEYKMETLSKVTVIEDEDAVIEATVTNKGSRVVETGDSTNIVFYCLIALISGITIVLRKKKYKL